MLKRKSGVYIILAVLLLIAVITSLSLGAFAVEPGEVVSILLSKLGINTGIAFDDQSMAAVDSRLTRVLLSILVGAALAVSGASLQGIFRNPLVDSGLIGIASGASFFAALYIVLGASIPFLAGGHSDLTMAFVAF